MVYVGILFLGVLLGFFLRQSRTEGFVDVTETSCNICQKNPCNCRRKSSVCGPGGSVDGTSSGTSSGSNIDMSKYILKASVPPCPSLPDMTSYMLKSECPAPPDMTKYILKSAAPACPPCISTCNKPCKIGECPPCPRPRCPVVQCPEPKSCPPCASVEPPRCPDPTVSCKAQYAGAGAGSMSSDWLVRPMLSTIHDM